MGKPKLLIKIKIDLSGYLKMGKNWAGVRLFLEMGVIIKVNSEMTS
jgi:hypothetical protein